VPCVKMKQFWLHIGWASFYFIMAVQSLNLYNKPNPSTATTPLIWSYASSAQSQTITPISSNIPLNRRESINVLSTFVTVPLLLLSSPPAAYADKMITNKLASPSALKYTKSSIKVLSNLELYASTNDYEQVKSGLRGPGLDQLRKNLSILVGSIEEGPVKENLVSKYSQFIQALEKLDSEASLGIRGRKNIDMAESYQECMRDLNAFLDSAEKIVIQI